MTERKEKQLRIRRMRNPLFCLAGIVLLLVYFKNPILEAAMEISYVAQKNLPEIRVDFNDTTGAVKPLHGINNGPKSGYTDAGQWTLDMTELYQSVHIPFVRTHDTEYPYGQDRFVDIHCIFPDMTKDVDDPEAYHFEETDKYLEAVAGSGAEIFFRLGESIDHSGENKYINPPEDYTKWSQICEHIIRHYNEGWADGYHYNIVYWEIWNEPDNVLQWTGSMEQYYELYRTAARYLKEVYPDIKIGGCAMANASEENLLKFLQSLTADGQDTPLDFFSWHRYTNDPGSYSGQAEEIRKLLDAAGYGTTEIILDEWNYVEDWSDLTSTAETVHSVKGGSFIAASLITLQNSPVDLAMYYDSQYALADYWCGLYDAGGNTEPGYYAFYFYDQLCGLGEQVRIEGSADHLYCCAAAGEGRGMLLTNYAGDDGGTLKIRLQLGNGKQKVRITRINAENPEGVTDEQIWIRGHAVLSVGASEVIYIELE